MSDDGIRPRWRRYAAGAALAVGGLVVGGVLASGAIANAADSLRGGGTAHVAPAATDRPGGEVDESRSRRPDETLLTGDVAAKVREAALARYPGATIQRVETDSDGVYEAHLVTTDGQRVTVEVGKDFTVTGTEQGGRR
ncbi:MAG TPA: hypothetical protein VFM54_06895 [Micromonosporaceae bacterium]|nr:hypothetical protein [Micromonosporaceae bacterium]